MFIYLKLIATKAINNYICRYYYPELLRFNLVKIFSLDIHALNDTKTFWSAVNCFMINEILCNQSALFKIICLLNVFFSFLYKRIFKYTLESLIYFIFRLSYICSFVLYIHPIMEHFSAYSVLYQKFLYFMLN